MIDGWSSFRTDYPDLEPAVLALTQRGLAHGMHVLIGTHRWTEVRPAMKESMTSRFELRLGEPAESEIDRRAAATVPDRAPGRGLTVDGCHLLTACLSIDRDRTRRESPASPHVATSSGGAGVPADSGRSAPISDGVASLVGVLAATWPESGAPPIRMLPDRLPLGRLGRPVSGGRLIPIGVRESDLAVAELDLRHDPHLLVFGDPGAGKTTFLALLGSQLATSRPPTDVRLLLIDYRRNLERLLPTEYLAGAAVDGASAARLLGEAATLLRGRLPTASTTRSQLEARSWWTGPELFVLVDDYDLMQGSPDNPLPVLLDLLPRARDVGLHLIVCRRAGGAARSLYDPVVQRLRELGAAGLLMSGPPEEGALIGDCRPRRLPPGRGQLLQRNGVAQLVQLALPN